MNVAVITPFPEGILKFRGPLLAAMRARGHVVTVLLPCPPDEIVAGLKALDCPWQPISLRRAGMNPLHDLRAISELSVHLRDLRADVSFSYNPKGVIYGTLAAARAGVPHRFAMVTGLGYAFSQKGLKPLLARLAACQLYRRAVPRCERLFFQNEHDLATFRRLGLLHSSVPVEVVPGTGVDIERFQPAPLPEHVTFLMAARLLKDKGVREFAEAAGTLHREQSRTMCRLAGWLDANPAAITQAELDEWMRTGDVEYLGRLADVRPAIVSASVFVLPSYREGLSMAVLEAMAMGRAIVTTDVPGCRELVEHGVNGLIVPPADAAALTAAMRTLVANPSQVRAMGKASRLRVEQRFDSRLICGYLIDRMGL